MATIVTRAGKGAALTHQEVDANFTGLNTELGQKEVASNKGIANGYASLDAAGKVPSAQLPSYVDDVVEVANFASLPGTGETGKIYVTIDTNKTYRWTGSAYIEISASPGSTDSLAEGSTNLYFTQARARASVSASGSLSYNSTTGVFSFSDAVTSVAGRTGAVTLTSSDVGLGNVENKSSATIRGELTSSNVTTALGFTPYNATNPSGYISGNQTITVSGDASGSGATSIALTLANSGVAAGTYTKVTVDAKGRVTTGASLASGDLPTYTGTITSSQVTTALGYTPYNSTNPSGYITSSALSSYLPLTGGTLTGSLTVGSDGGGANYIQRAINGWGDVVQVWRGGSNVWNLQDSSGSAKVTSSSFYVGSNLALHAGNYNSYSPTLTGGGASGTWGINITGTARGVGTSDPALGTGGLWVTTGTGLNVARNNTSYVLLDAGNYTGYNGILRALGGADGMDFNTLNYNSMYYAEINGSANKPTSYSYNYGTILTFDPGLGVGGRAQFYVSHAGNDLTFRGGWGGNGSWQTWNKVLTNQNYTSYSPSLTGAGATGTWGISISGNAATVSNGMYLSGDQSISGAKIFATPTGQTYNTASGNIGLTVYNAGWNPGDAMMTFHVSNDYAGYFGLGGAENDLVWTGWSVGNNRHRIIHTGNYTFWVPTLTGTGASGTWGISITGNAATATSAGSLSANSDYIVYRGGVAQGSIDTATTSGIWTQQNPGDSHTVIAANGYGSTGTVQQRFHYTGLMEFRNRTDSASWTSWKTVLTTSNYNSYSPTLTGTGASGTWGISITGNAATVGGLAESTFMRRGVDTWHTSSDGQARLYFGNGGRSYYRSANGHEFRNSSDSNIGVLDNSGNFTATANVTAYSDERVKANWRHLDGGFLVKLSSVKSGIYDRTDAEITQVGVSAQSLRDVLPHAVIESHEGNLSVAYGNAALVSAVELAKELVALKQEVAELRARVH